MSTARRTRGLILINTGNGKGKTTAAIGTAFRALGHGMRVGMIQFIKGKWKTGERKLGEQTPNLARLTMGHGFTWESLDLDRDRAADRSAWDIARKWLLDESYDLVVFDEITYVIKLRLRSARRGALGIADPARRSSRHSQERRKPLYNRELKDNHPHARRLSSRLGDAETGPLTRFPSRSLRE